MPDNETVKKQGKDRRTGTIMSVVKALDLVNAMLELGEPASLNTLSKMTGFPKSTAYAILSTMRDKKYITQNEEGKYYLGIAFYECGQAVSRNWNISSISRPYLEMLSHETNSTAVISIVDNQSIYNIDYISGGSDIQMIPDLGKSLPTHASSQGKLLISSFSPIKLSKHLEAHKMFAFTTSTITDKEKLIKELDKIKKEKYAISDSEFIYGMRSISAPVYDHDGELKFCISTLSMARAIKKEELKKMVGLVKDAANRISDQLGFTRW